MNESGGGAILDLEGYLVIGSGGGATCKRCGSYVWQDEDALKRHRDWHRDLDRKTQPPSPAAKDRALGQHLD